MTVSTVYLCLGTETILTESWPECTNGDPRPAPSASLDTVARLFVS